MVRLWIIDCFIPSFWNHRFSQSDFILTSPILALFKIDLLRIYLWPSLVQLDSLFHLIWILIYFCFDGGKRHFCCFDILHSFFIRCVIIAILNFLFDIHFFIASMFQDLSVIFTVGVFWLTISWDIFFGNLDLSPLLSCRLGSRTLRVLWQLIS